MSCQIYITDFHWCGQMWLGKIIKCDECKEKELRLEYLRLQNQIARKQLVEDKP